MEDSSRITTMAAILGVGAVTNILLTFCLAHTWRHWRQVKFYVLLLLVANVLSVALNQGLSLAQTLNRDVLTDSTASCRFLFFVYSLGPSLMPMAIAALALHVLLTFITGNQGNLLRHGMVLGLFVLLALPTPFTMIAFTRRTSMGGYEEVNVCLYSLGSTEEMTSFVIGQSVAVFFFPLLVILICSVTAGVLFCTASRATVKGDEDKSDLILTYLLGVAMVVFCAPYCIQNIVMVTDNSMHHGDTITILLALFDLNNCFPFITALICVVFAYAHAFRNRGKCGEFLPISGESSSASGERQKLVN